jgi:glycosyltransferase involved in cell wall biosynthesis
MQPAVKLAVFATHPVQYQVPWFQALARHPRCKLKVYYGMVPDARQQGHGFGVSFQWDIPLFEGYDWEVLANRRASPGLDGFFRSSAKGLAVVLRRDRPDVVLLTGWQQLPLLQALAAAMRLRIPRIVRGESNAMKPRAWRVKLVHRVLLACFDGFLAIGKSSRRFYQEYGIDSARIFPCNYFVDNDRFATAAAGLAQQRQGLRDKLGIPRDAVSFLYSGKLNHKKRITDLLAAVKAAISSNGNLHLLVVGDGELMEDARHFAKQHHLPVVFSGFLNQTEIVAAYVACDCLVLPSDYGETWGLVVNEAMACARPAIVSDRVGCSPDLVEEGVTGYHFPCGDVEALSCRLLAVAADAEATRLMGERAQARVLRHYSVEKAVEGTLAAVDAVLRRRS